MKMRTGAENLIFWGAGATATMGQRPTGKQGELIHKLVGKDKTIKLKERVENALYSPQWTDVFVDLLCILGDDVNDDNQNDIYYISKPAREAMKKHWEEQTDSAIEQRIHFLRSQFDWSALKEIVRVCPNFLEEKLFQITDVFNIIDMHRQSKHGFPVENGFLPLHRIASARAALELILQTTFYIDWQTCLTDKKLELDKHLRFASLLTEHHQNKGLELVAEKKPFDSRDFYLGDIAFVSLNYDPIALWAQFVANRDANLKPPCIGFPSTPLKIFHDFGIFMAVSTIADNNQKERLWYPMNEASAQRLNDTDHNTRRVRINKFLFPHGCLCWRECPSCGKLGAYMGKHWDIDSKALFLPPPLRGFVQWDESLLRPEEEEKEAWQRGEVDARACVFCGVLTYAQHTQTVMQSNFKEPPPPFIEEVQRDLRVAVQSAEHIILMGYSLPPDDVTYRAFFAARKQHGNNVKCSVVVDINYGDKWHYRDEIDDLLENMEKPCEAPKTTLESARALFGKDNVRFYGGGIPQVFCDGDIASKSKFEQLINWDI